MKQKFKFLLLLCAVTTLFVNCEKEDINSYYNHNSLKISSRKATVNEVLHKINNPSIKQKIVYENNRIVGKNNDINPSQNLRINSQDSIFTVIEKENDFTTYLLPINSYTTENPFFLKYIITVDVNNIERSGYIKYIPSTPTGNLNLGTFSGTVEVYNIEDELIGLTTFENGIAQPQTSNSHNRVICYDQVTINEVTCSHGGGHGVGESCTEGFINDAYWYVSITTVCNYDPTTIVQIIDDSSNPSMGGGSSNLNPNTTTLNKIINNLTMAQIDWWYSQNTSQAIRDAIVNYVNQHNSTQNEEQQAIDIAIDAINSLMDDECAILPTTLNPSEIEADYDPNLFGDYPAPSVQQDHDAIQQQFNNLRNTSGNLAAVNYLISTYNMNTFGPNTINMNYSISFADGLVTGDHANAIIGYNPSGTMVTCELQIDTNLFSFQDFGYITRVIKHELYHVLQAENYGQFNVSNAAREFDAYYSQLFGFRNLKKINDIGIEEGIAKKICEYLDQMTESEKNESEQKINTFNFYFLRICNN